MTKLGVLGAAIALCFAAATGCGGAVIWDGSGGAGGTTNPQSFCDGICASANAYGCLGGGTIEECALGCAQVFEQYPSCSKETQDLYSCLVDQFASTGCDAGAEACQTETTAFAECAGGSSTCGSNECGGSGTGMDCFCTGECNNHVLEADCKSDGTTIGCACYVDGSVVGQCNDVDLACDVFNGCCAAYFPI